MQSYKPMGLLALAAFILLVGLALHFLAKMVPQLAGFVAAAYG